MSPVNQPPVNPQWDTWQPQPVSGQDLSSHPPASPAARVGARLLNEVLVIPVLIPFQLINEGIVVRLLGGNLGKLMMGLRVIDPDTGHFVSIGKALLRYLILNGPWIVAVGISLLVPAYMELINNVVSFGWWLVLLLSFALAPPLFQGFQDRWSNSRVVKKVKQF